jgi:hypothetical protein
MSSHYKRDSKPYIWLVHYKLKAKDPKKGKAVYGTSVWVALGEGTADNVPFD